MKEKRKLRRETISKTRQIAFYRNAEASTQFSCNQCGGDSPMLAPELIAETANITSRQVYRMIEKAQMHFVETENKKIFVCLLTFGEAMENELKLLIEGEEDKKDKV